MFKATSLARNCTRAAAAALLVMAWPVAASSAGYPPTIAPPSPDAPVLRGGPGVNLGPIFTNTHTYAFGLDPAAVKIKVDVYNNYLGDFTKYQWVYTVSNKSYNPLPPTSNGFSGFELGLPLFVPDIADITAPDGIGPWLINCCSGAPVEWDLTDTGGAPVGGGTLPGQTEVYSFTTLPRLITISTGWFHTWEFDSQTDLVFYPTGDGPEVPDLLSAPNQELCCSKDSLTGAYLCRILPAGECSLIGGTVVPDCMHCPPITPTLPKTWGKVKDSYRK